MKNLVSVPNPCHASWDKMIPKDNGRHCNSCDKVVVDFSSMSDEAIRNYFKNHHTQKFCGHFRADQVKRLKIHVNPHSLKNKGWDIYQISKVAIFLVFFSSLFSCTLKNDDGSSAEIVIENALANEDSTKHGNKDIPMVEGKVAPFEYDSMNEKRAPSKLIPLRNKKERTELLGEPEIMEVVEEDRHETLTGIPRLEEE